MKEKQTLHFYSQSPRRAIPYLKKLEGLALDDLRKIKRSFNAFEDKLRLYDAEVREIRAQNDKASVHNSKMQKLRADWEQKNLSPVIVEIERQRRVLNSYRVGFIARRFCPTIEFEGVHYDAVQARELISKIEEGKRRLASLVLNLPDSGGETVAKYPRRPKDETTISIGGQKLRVNLAQLNTVDLDRLIAGHEDRLEAERARSQELKARAASNEVEKRRQAQSIRRSLSKQLSALGGCPYCQSVLSPTTAHLDHIYPVSKGGNSTKKNLVFVCSSCNIAKRDMTLRNFLKLQKINEASVYERLETLGKDF